MDVERDFVLINSMLLPGILNHWIQGAQPKIMWTNEAVVLAILTYLRILREHDENDDDKIAYFSVR